MKLKLRLQKMNMEHVKLPHMRKPLMPVKLIAVVASWYSAEQACEPVTLFFLLVGFYLRMNSFCQMTMFLSKMSWRNVLVTEHVLNQRTRTRLRKRSPKNTQVLLQVVQMLRLIPTSSSRRKRAQSGKQLIKIWPKHVSSPLLTTINIHQKTHWNWNWKLKVCKNLIETTRNIW